MVFVVWTYIGMYFLRFRPKFIRKYFSTYKFHMNLMRIMHNSYYLQYIDLCIYFNTRRVKFTFYQTKIIKSSSRKSNRTVVFRVRRKLVPRTHSISCTVFSFYSNYKYSTINKKYSSLCYNGVKKERKRN